MHPSRILARLLLMVFPALGLTAFTAAQEPGPEGMERPAADRFEALDRYLQEQMNVLGLPVSRSPSSTTASWCIYPPSVPPTAPGAP